MPKSKLPEKVKATLEALQDQEEECISYLDEGTYLFDKDLGLENFEEYGIDNELVIADTDQNHHDGADCYIVFKIDGNYYQLDYTYSSWDSSDFYWNNVKQVYPKEKTIITWSTKQ